MKYWRHIEDDLNIWPDFLPGPPDDPEKLKSYVAAGLLFIWGILLIVLGCL